MGETECYDVIIVGGGPAGFAAALYAARDRYSTLILEKNGLAGGQIMLTEEVENYPAIPRIGGPEMIQQMQQQVEAFGAEIATSKQVTSLRRSEDDECVVVEVDGGETTYLARAVILSPGSDYRQLGVPGEDEMRQATRVSYCATCDGAFYRDKHVLAVGGGNTAVEDAVYLASRFCRKVTLIHRRREFRAQQVLVDELYEQAEKNIDVKLPYVLEKIVGNEAKDDIDHALVRNVETGACEELDVEGVFIFVGMNPNTGFLKGTVEMSDAGYIACDPVSLRTSMKGVFVAGDCRQQAAMQLATACSDGVVTALMLKNYFRNSEWWEEQEPQISTAGW